MENIIKFNNVIKRYGNFNALNELSFNIKKNSTNALVGNNGCGKTTTINVLCNLVKYDFGELYVKDKLINSDYTSYKSTLGMILSKPYYIEDFNAKEYLTFICKYQKVPKPEISDRIRDLFSMLKIELRSNLPIKKLSSGNQMKVSIAAALIHNPGILVLDEPFIYLDIETIELLKSLLHQFKGKKTLLITSHNLDLVADLCDTFLIMDKGKIISEIQKSDHPKIEDLKEDIKQKLSVDERKIDLQWLR